METSTVYEVIMKLVGPVNPVGDSTVDEPRYVNLQRMCEVVDLLVRDIDRVGMMRGDHQYSVKRAGEYASNYLTHGLGIPDEDASHA
jgi:uncharacterized protein related to proFAR isomerase